MDCSPPGSSIHGTLQARILEWVAISFSNAWKWKVKGKSLSRDRLLATPWTAAHQAPPSMGLSRQEYWSGVPLPSPPGIWAPPKKQWDSCCIMAVAIGWARRDPGVASRICGLTVTGEAILMHTEVLEPQNTAFLSKYLCEQMHKCYCIIIYITILLIML